MLLLMRLHQAALKFWSAFFFKKRAVNTYWFHCLFCTLINLTSDNMRQQATDQHVLCSAFQTSVFTRKKPYQAFATFSSQPFVSSLY